VARSPAAIQGLGELMLAVRSAAPRDTQQYPAIFSNIQQYEELQGM
jgi:hypothetical protein